MELTTLNLTLPLSPPCATPTQIGIPFPKGRLFTSNRLSILTQQSQILASHAEVTSRWPDGSIQWATLYLVIPERFPAGQHPLKLVAGSPETQSKTVASQSPDVMVASTHNFRVTLSTKTLASLSVEDKNQCPIIKASNCVLADTLGQAFTGENKQIAVTSQNPIYVQIENSGRFINPQDAETRSNPPAEAATFKSLWTIYNHAPFIKFNLTVRNPKAATHPDGLWDLGDPASLLINALQLKLQTGGTCQSCVSPATEFAWTDISDSFTLKQYTSGGENWNSPNHKNAKGDVPFALNGYALSDSSNTQTQGKRATPIVFAALQDADSGCGVYLENFWQNFPKAITTDNNSISVDLFPNLNGPTELQAGEQKTYTGYLYVGNDKTALESLRQPAVLSVDPNWVNACGVLPWFTTETTNNNARALIQNGITGTDSFFHKREVVDEYGWRNFGDLYADHETLGYTGQEIFVSHYNNQYDPIYGFLRQYLRSGDQRWFELANDLAHHVIDIDIYHTTADRAEYNLGPFWHTDHYLDAGTSTHRTYSKDHLKTLEHTGGGPGGQHCYTTGLTYHYWLTGEEASKTSVLELTQWITNYYEGTGGLLELALNFKNRADPGLKKYFSTQHPYPLDRGIGNYINALLDSHALTYDYSYIQRAEHVIAQTVHPNDPITLRNFADVEGTWFYTVFFQALSRYLLRKEELNEIDSPFQYARATLLHYANWVINNEQPYLNTPDILEYPNHTWAAQDIRKANIAYCASRYAQTPQEAEHLKTWANQHHAYVVKELSEHETKTFTRILAILMQNDGPHDYYSAQGQPAQFGAIDYRSFGLSPMAKPKSPLLAILQPTCRAVFNFRFSRELDWLKRRTAPAVTNGPREEQ